MYTFKNTTETINYYKSSASTCFVMEIKHLKKQKRMGNELNKSHPVVEANKSLPANTSHLGNK